MGLFVDLRFGVTKAYLAVITTQGTKTRGYYTVRVSKGADNFPLQAEDTHFGWLDHYDPETPNWKQAYADFKTRWARGLLPPIYTGVYEEDGTPVAGFVGQDDINIAREREAARRTETTKPLAKFVPEPVPAPTPEPAPEPTPEPTPDAVVFEEPAPDPELETLRARITELEALVVELTPPPPSEITEPPPEVLAEAHPDETLAELKARLLLEFASLRNMLIGHIPMTEPQLLRLQALEHPKFQTWLQA